MRGGRLQDFQNDSSVKSRPGREFLHITLSGNLPKRFSRVFCPEKIFSELLVPSQIVVARDVCGHLSQFFWR